MTVGLPGAGVGGLFYLASTFLLPFRSLFNRLRGRPDPSPGRQVAYTVAIAAGIVASLTLTGWLLALVVPREVLQPLPNAAGAATRARTVLPAATFATAVGTLLVVLAAVEIARYAQSRRDPSRLRGRKD